jgi:hypothetical protein
MSKIIIHLQFCPLSHPLSRGKPPPTGFFIFILWFQKVGETFPFFGNFFKLSKITKQKKKLDGHRKVFLKPELCRSPNENSHLLNIYIFLGWAYCHLN